MERNARRAAVPLLLAVLAALPAHAQSYDVINLGLGGGTTRLTIAGINANGQVAGSAYTASGEYHAFFASPSTGVIDLGTLGDGYSEALGITASGMVVGNSGIPNDVAVPRPFVWTKDGGLVNIGSLGGRRSNAFGFNDAGTVVGASDGPDGRYHAFAWSPGGPMYGLGGVDNALGSFAVAINASGYAAGYAMYSQFIDTGLFFLPGGGANNIGAWSGANTAQAIAISDANHVLGQSSWVDAEWGTVSKTLPFVYTDRDGMANVGTLGGTSSTARAINKQGRVIGESQMPGDNPNAMHAFTWARVGGIVDLTLGGASRTSAINENGLVVGASATTGGANHAYSWTLAGGIVDLGTLGGSTSIALDVNATGQIVGQAAVANDATTHAFLFDNGLLKDLNNLTPRKPAGLELLSATMIAANGAIVAASNTGFVLLSPPSATPAAPTVSAITANDPVAVGASVAVSANFTDATTDTHTASWAFGDGSAPQSGTISEANGSGTTSATHTYAAAGVYPVVVTVTDNGGLRSQVNRDVVVYDPSNGFVTGSGMIQSPAGAYKPDPVAMGPANFSFVSKYQKGANVPTGTTSFRFQTVGLDFYSDTYDWLVVAGARAQFKGSGSLNDGTGYQFMLTAVDGDLLGGGAADRFRIKIWRYDDNTKQDVIVYDNQLDSSTTGTTSEGTAIHAGQIVIHAAKK